MSQRLRIFLFIIINSIFYTVQGQVTFIIESLPSTTLEEDSIFICGSFNNWNTHDEKYLLHPQLNGNYSITLPADTGTIQFKFLRNGNWMKVETSERNENLPNRVFTYGNGKTVYVKILNWQDLGGVKHFNYLILFLFAAAFYGLTLLFLVYRIQKCNRSKFITFLISNIILLITLLGSVMYNITNLIWQSHIAMLGYVLFFTWGPTLFIYINTLRLHKPPKKIFIHYIPVLFIVLFVVLRYINFKPLMFLSKEINLHLTLGSTIVMLLGIGVNIYYHACAVKYLQLNQQTNEDKTPKEVQLINIIFLTSIIALLFLCINILRLTTGLSLGIQIKFEIVLIILSFIIFVEFFYYWKFPEILRDKVVQHPINDASNLITQLTELMKTSKPFKNPELNIAELSDLLNTKPHILSKMINEHYNKNFRDFINEYRVKEFIAMSISEEYKNYTFLALAYEVGFNSKSTFNLVFKKNTGLSPRNYMKQKFNIIKDK
ncbi:MAG: helix-turn-helix domain-containing protein [Bacteroidales bacterium]|nr:helix-turn-helix domain-containing protein [Bacteroidales bacterium]